jgi:hypothetical protein
MQGVNAAPGKGRRAVRTLIAGLLVVSLLVVAAAWAAESAAPAKVETPAKAGAPAKSGAAKADAGKSTGKGTAPATAAFPPPPGGLIKAPDDGEEGFTPIFNGKDLTGWDGNPDLWSAKDGVLHGETTKEKPTKGNTFCIWRGGTVEDFELRLSFRMQTGNSGVQYRSKDLGNWVVGGYQAEVANEPGRAGFIYDEKGKRGRMCLVGEKVVWKDGKKEVVGSVGDYKKIQETFKLGDWNDYRIIARGNHLVQYLNGVQTVDFTDEDEANRTMSGIVAVQIHAGGPMVVEFKNIRLKKFDTGVKPPAETPKTQKK